MESKVMTDDERARDTLDKLIQEIHVYRDGEIYYNTEVMKAHLILFARDERRRAFEDCAKIAEKRQGIHGEYIATAIRRQAEEESHG